MGQFRALIGRSPAGLSEPQRLCLDGSELAAQAALPVNRCAANRQTCRRVPYGSDAILTWEVPAGRANRRAELALSGVVGDGTEQHVGVAVAETPVLPDGPGAPARNSSAYSEGRLTPACLASNPAMGARA
jgi:hypothetical protein